MRTTAEQGRSAQPNMKKRGSAQRIRDDDGWVKSVLSVRLDEKLN